MPMTLTRSLLTVILPGMVAVAPWFLVAMMANSDLRLLYTKYQVPFHVAAFGVAVLLGSIFEEIGCYLERRWDTDIEEGGEPGPSESWLIKDWYAYLGMCFGDSEPVGYRYASRKVTSLYFEIAMMFAAPCCFAGLAMLFVALQGHLSHLSILFFVFAALGFLLFSKMARDTHQLLCELRHFLPQYLKRSQ
jgi:hypothetical protein